MTVPLSTRQDIREMDALGVPRAEIARRLDVSRNTVAKYADEEDMSPAAPVPEARPHPATDAHAAWIASVLEADLGAPRKQRHTARRIYDRLVAERGYSGSYSSVCRFVADWRRARSAASPREGYLELVWAPGTAQVDFGNFRCEVAGRAVDAKLLVVTLPHSNARYCTAMMSERSECLCDGLREVFEWIGRAPSVLVLDNATEAGRMVRGEVTESRLFSQFRMRYRCASRYCNPYSGNEKGSVENAVGFLRRNLLVPEPRVSTMGELNAALRAGCDRINASSLNRDGAPTREALAEDLAGMLALPGVPFDSVRWVAAKADKRGVVEVDGCRYVAGPAWHGRGLLAGMRRDTVELVDERGRRVDAEGVGRRRDRSQPPVARPGIGRQTEGVRGVDDPRGHAEGPRRRDGPLRQGGAPPGAARDIACGLRIRVRRGMRGRREDLRCRQDPRRRLLRRAGPQDRGRRGRSRRGVPVRVRRLRGRGGGRDCRLARGRPSASWPRGRRAP